MKSENRDIFIKFGVTESEKETFKNFAKESKLSLSEFVRQAVFDKMRRIKHPELLSQSSINQLNPLVLEQITQNTKKTLELQELILKRQEQFDNVTESMRLIELYSKGHNLEAESNVISNLLDAHKSLSQNQLIEKSGFDKEIVWAVVSNRDVFKLNITTGKFSKR